MRINTLKWLTRRMHPINTICLKRLTKTRTDGQANRDMPKSERARFYEAVKIIILNVPRTQLHMVHIHILA